MVRCALYTLLASYVKGSGKYLPVAIATVRVSGADWSAMMMMISMKIARSRISEMPRTYLTISDSSLVFAILRTNDPLRCD